MIRNYPTSKSREQVYSDCFRWSAESILEAGVQLFDPDVVRWSSAYGGKKWWNIAKAGTMRHKLDAVVFIDHCVDLSHNNSVYFDKGAGMFAMLTGTSAYKEYLDKKRIIEPIMLLGEPVGALLVALIERAFALGILDRRTVLLHPTVSKEGTLSEQRVLAYVRKKWSDTPLSCCIIGSGCDPDEDEDEEEEDEDDYGDEEHDEEEYDDDEHESREDT